MIGFEKFTLANGLRVLVHEDSSTPLAAVNLVYDVGARDEFPDKTGFAHLFEHLMFGGSVNIPRFDEPLQLVGGENNAFTNNDITNYYITLPSHNLETAFWLESDRMLSLAFSEKSLEVQRHVVVEEFKERYLNEPYGDVWLLLRPLTYKVHPYQWATIGKEIAHVQQATLEDVKDFFKRFYCPNNAVLVVSGNVTTDLVKELCAKWFADIPSGPANKRSLPAEPLQTEARSLTVHRDVPFDAIYKAYHSCSRSDPEYYAIDLMSDLMSRGNSSRLYQQMVKNKKLFSEIHAYVTGDRDKGLFIIEGKLIKGVSPQVAETALQEEIDAMQNIDVNPEELTKVKNKIESTLEYSSMSALNKAMRLAFAELLGDADYVNREIELYEAVKPEDIREQAKKILRPENCSTLYYLSN